jgi:hypothetical protein
MKRIAILASLAAMALLTTPAAARSANHPLDYIPFASHGGIFNWRVKGDDTIYFEDNFHHWYKAELFAPSFDLPFKLALAVDTGPGGTLDQWSSVIIHGQRYPFRSFTRIEGKPPKEAR